MELRRALEGLRSPRTRVRLAALVAWSLAVAYLALASAHPSGTPSGGHTDHVAHIGEVRILPRVGLDIWTVPLGDLFPTMKKEDHAGLPPDMRAYAEQFPGDVLSVPGFPADRPLVTNYTHLPRCYPPGVFLFASPSAFLHSAGALGFAQANRLFLAILMSTWLGFVFACTSSWREVKVSLGRELGLVAASAYLAYWSIEGMYDVIAIAAAAYGIEYTRREEHGKSALAWGVATLVHSRLLALGPLFAYAAFRGVKAWPRSTRAERAQLVGGGALYAGALAFAALIQPTVARNAAVQPHRINLFHPLHGPVWSDALYGVIVTGAAIALWRRGHRWDGALVGFAAVAFATQRYLTPWYWLLVLPWALGPAREQVSSPRVRAIAQIALTVLFFVGSVASSR